MNMFNGCNNENVFNDYRNVRNNGSACNVFSGFSPLDNMGNTDGSTTVSANSCQSAHTPNFDSNASMNMNMNMNLNMNPCLYSAVDDDDDKLPPLPTMHQLMSLCQALTSGDRNTSVDLHILYVYMFAHLVFLYMHWFNNTQNELHQIH